MIDPKHPDFLGFVQGEVVERMDAAPAGSTLWFKLFDLSKSLEYAIVADTAARHAAQEPSA